MYCRDYKYFKDDIFILDFDILTDNKIQKSFIELQIFSLYGTPVDNAIVRVISLDGLNEYIINIYACGYYPFQINDIKFYPNSVCKLNVNLINSISKNQGAKLNVYSV